MEHSCEIILNLDKWFRSRCYLKEKFIEIEICLNIMMGLQYKRPKLKGQRSIFGT